MKVERNVYSGVELQPNVRAMWSVSERDSIWTAVTRGVRTPSLLENGANVKVATAPGPQGLPAVITVIGDGTSAVESLWATEVGYRRHWSTVSVDVSAFRNHYGSLFSLNPGVPELVLRAVAVRPRPLPDRLRPARARLRRRGLRHVARAPGLDADRRLHVPRPRSDLGRNRAARPELRGHRGRHPAAPDRAALAVVLRPPLGSRRGGVRARQLGRRAASRRTRVSICGPAIACPIG